MRRNNPLVLVWLFIMAFCLIACNSSHPDIILTNGKVITVDKDFTISEAIAIEKDKIVAVGSNVEIRKRSGRKTRIIDLKGKTVIPGLIDAHLHPESASVSELEGEIPDLHTVAELLDWIKNQAAVKDQHEWIIHPKLFFTRLKELRQPSLAELDKAAPG